MKVARFILLFAITIVVGSSGSCYAQDKPNFGREPKIRKGAQTRTYKTPKLNSSTYDWRANRLEYIASGGASIFLGDLGGQDGVGKPFLYDVDPTQIRWATGLEARYFLREYHALRGGVSYARVRGTDLATNYPNRRFRNLTVKSPIIELSLSYDFFILRPDVVHYTGARSTNILDGNRLSAYLSAGAGFFIYNPKGELQGQWYALKPLGTEGQGLPGGPDPYRRWSVCVPMGGGITYLFAHNITVGLNVGYRWTMTDYIDDASGYYYDNATIRAEYGKLAALMANPSVLVDNVPNRDWYTAGQPRGGGNSNDTYSYVLLTVSYPFTPSAELKEFKPGKRKPSRSYKPQKQKKVEQKGGKTRTYRNKGIKTVKSKSKAPKMRYGKRTKRSKIRTF